MGGGKIMDKVVHFEIPADNLARAQKFYKEIFGWQINKWSGEGDEYYMVTTVETDKEGMPKTPGAVNGGMMKRQVPGETPIIVINVSSIDGYLIKIEKAGGKTVVPKMPVGDFGLYARVSDTEGNVIGLWQDLK